MMARLFVALTSVVTFPPRLAHEATHAAFTAPHADDWRFSVAPMRGAAAVTADWAADAPRWGIVLAHLGPLLCGAALGVFGLAWVVAVGYTPASVESWFTVAILATWWGIYTTPSGGDLAVLGGNDAAE